MIEIEGLVCEEETIYKTGIKQSELYMAKRNTGWKLLTCREYNKETEVVFPKEDGYAFDSWECHRVVEK